MIEISEALSIDDKIHYLLQNEHKLNVKKDFRIKCEIQSYDIRDSDRYEGILETHKAIAADDN